LSTIDAILSVESNTNHSGLLRNRENYSRTKICLVSHD